MTPTQPDKETTFFGLEIVQKNLIRLNEIKQLPFYDFWLESSVGSAVLVDKTSGEEYVYLHDFERFSRLFIETGKHRYSANKANSEH